MRGEEKEENFRQLIITTSNNYNNNNNEPYQNFINSLQSEYIQETYRRTLMNFLLFLQINKDDDDCYSKLLKYDVKTIENFIRDYILDMRKRNLSTSTTNRNCAAIKHFFDINDIDEMVQET